MLGSSDGGSNVPGNFQMPIDEVDDIDNLGAVQVLDEEAQKLADEKLAFEARMRFDHLVEQLGMEQKPLVYCPIQDLFVVLWLIVKSQSAILL